MPDKTQQLTNYKQTQPHPVDSVMAIVVDEHPFAPSVSPACIQLIVLPCIHRRTREIEIVKWIFLRYRIIFGSGQYVLPTTPSVPKAIALNSGEAKKT